ncbi:ArsR/SmtB family transcription factor [Nocardioides ferulae]|uniref:ArsR/SmtB family transcription factor n=1 Tax=Nocardioides ferulae TaxID=2340821 RepID=UPI000EB596E2|nr:DUF5937 family protein [Nocardioides ferulae]
MIEYELAGADLGEVRFAISPLHEAVLSLRALREPGRYPLHLPWLAATEPARRDLDLELLVALTNAALWTPDFLTPRPHSPLTRFEDELDGVARTPLSVVRDDLTEVHPDADTRPEALDASTSRLLGRIVTALADYWSACFEPWWPRMRAVLEADIVHRGRVIARSGLAAMFADLSPRVRLVDEVVQVSLSSGHHFRRSTAGEGLTLVPTTFTRNASAPISPEEAPVIMYAARGVGTLWAAETAGPVPGALAALIGAARARLLGLLESPASSTELAVRLGVTPTAVNQHLRAMRDAGLLTSARHGRSVLYLRSELGDELHARAG